MLDLFNTPSKTNANVQMFYRNATWNKPRGCSQVFMLLIGAGGNGAASVGGGSGAITKWYGAAQNIPDILSISIGVPNSIATTVNYISNTTIAILTANSGNGSTAGAASTSNFFGASGFFSSVAGQNGAAGSIAASTSTLLSGGGGNTVIGNYGYQIPNGSDGFFLTQPLLLGLGGAGTGKQGGIGCGGGPSPGLGGFGFAAIIAL